MAKKTEEVKKEESPYKSCRELRWEKLTESKKKEIEGD